ncbi:potassium voltage-gated channel subfamily KQT member 1 [Biomphalaria pfeifferi]|uniref:Potassium voltage-gated channel subfamily KQT member 1 n=1 Tax=Biomphalaria pfeifferi TaxID=112525 RepID=A0AAD8AQZ3_BIOPF|nr:potassium voltage-gated channel subfamily KQT member 1 [Biomphalaria pfeifferi]
MLVTVSLVPLQRPVAGMRFLRSMMTEPILISSLCGGQYGLDQTIGKPAYYGNIRDKEKLTLCSRIGRIETQINRMDLKLDQTIVLLNILVHQQKHPTPSEDTSPETLENS